MAEAGSLKLGIRKEARFATGGPGTEVRGQRSEVRRAEGEKKQPLDLHFMIRIIDIGYSMYTLLQNGCRYRFLSFCISSAEGFSL
jgi:hypothetical protein